MLLMNTSRLSFIIPFLLLAFGLRAQDLAPIGTEFLVNQHIPNEQSFPHVASEPDGAYVIVWRSWNQQGSGGSIWARRYGADHQPITDEFQVATGVGATDRPYVYHWSEGRFVIVWTGSSATNLRVLQADNTLGDVFALSVGASFDMDIRGDQLLVAYTVSPHVRLRKWNLLQNDWIANHTQASEAPSNNYKLPQVRWTSTGSIVLLYGGGSGTQHIYRKTFNANLLAQTPEASVFSINGSLGAINVSISALDQLLFYSRYGIGGIDGFIGRVLDASGAVLIQSVGGAGAPYAYYYTDCELYDNGAVVTTNNYKTSLNDPLDYCVRANYGIYLGSPNTGFQIASTTSSGAQRYPAVTKLPNSGFLMVWNGNGFQGDDDGIYARAFEASDFPTAINALEGPVVEAFPNPFRDQLFVTMEHVTAMEVLDAAGRSVLSHMAQPGTTTLHLAHLTPGAYVLSWQAADGTPMVVRVVKE